MDHFIEKKPPTSPPSETSASKNEVFPSFIEELVQKHCAHLFEKYDQEIKYLQTENKILRENYQKLECAHEVLKTELRLKDLEIEKRDRIIEVKELQIVKLEGTIVKLEDTIVKLEKKVEELEGTIVKLEGTIVKLEGTIVNLEGTIEKLEDEAKILRKNQKTPNTSEKNRDANNEEIPDGNSENNSGEDGNDGEKTNKQIYNSLCHIYLKQKRTEAKQEKSNGRIKDMSENDWHQVQNSEKGFIPFMEQQMDAPIGVEVNIDEPYKYVSLDEKMKNYGREKGYSSTIVRTKKYELKIQAITRNISYEVVTPTFLDTNNKSGAPAPKILSASCESDGPDNMNITWEGLANTLILILAYAVPMERIGRMIGNPYFSASNISRWIRKVAWKLLPIYLHLFEKMREADIFYMDDTNTKVDEMTKLAQKGKLISDIEADKINDEIEDEIAETSAKNKKSLAPLVEEIKNVMGRVAELKQSKGENKTKYNTSCINFQLDSNDSRSSVVFFRTHYGSCANLLSNSLGLSNNKEVVGKKIYIVSDMSTTNLLSEEIEKTFNVKHCGCYHHARRYVKKFETMDEELAYYLLLQFLKIEKEEYFARLAPVTEKKIQDARDRCRDIWEEIIDVVSTVLKGEAHPRAKNKIWQKGDQPYNSCEYIFNHKESLMIYLDVPKLSGVNTFVERAFRPMKRILDSCYLRKSEESQVAFDILRTFAASSECSGLKFKDYLLKVMTASDEEIKSNPQNFLPYSIAISGSTRK